MNDNAVKYLRDIAKIRAGVPFRKGVKPSDEGPYRLVQIKDVDKARPLRLDTLGRVEAPLARDVHRMRKGDVVIVARGRRHDAAVMREDADDVIAGAQLFIIRPGNTVLPEYLAWFLNQPAAQRHIEEYVLGSFVPFVPRAALDEMEVPVPVLEDQRRIVMIHELSLKEQELLDEIKAKRRQLVELQLWRTLAEARILDHSVRNLLRDTNDNEND